MLSRALVFSLGCLVAAFPASAQGHSNGAASPAPRPDYTFQANTRIVLTDVTVTDRDGNPVHGLKASDFRIYDNNKPQALASFEEHTTAPVAALTQASTTAGVYSNEFLRHLPPFLNIIVIDITRIGIPDQMYLNYKLTRFLNQLPVGQPLAIYWCTGPNSLLLQGFTSDRALLLAAVHRALPHFPPTGSEYYSDLATLHRIAFDLGQLPGRKNILWFTGGDTPSLRPDATGLQNQSYWRYVYGELESSRIAVYPIDVRGPIIVPGSALQQNQMGEIAEATGGRALYNNNGLTEFAAHLLDSDGSFYTLTYSPSDLRFDNKWHKIKVKVDADGSAYTLSYRRGYFADGGQANARLPEKPRTRLLAGGTTIKEADLRSVPIIFQAQVYPAAQDPSALLPANSAKTRPKTRPKKDAIRFSIYYLLPADAFTLQSVGKTPQIVAGIAVMAFNKDGIVEARQADRFTVAFNESQLPISSKMSVAAEQQIDLRKGPNYLYFTVWDMSGGRLGTLQIPFQVADPSKVQKPHSKSTDGVR